MKKVTAIGLLLIFSTLSFQALAKDEPKMQHSMSGKQGMQGQMTKEKMDTRMRSMQAHMLTMHDYANRILDEKDPDKKQQLKDEQLTLMKAHHMKMKAHRQKMKQMHQNMMQ